MLKHRTTYRVIYGDTDKMGVAYHANYLRWFEIGRAEMFRSLGLPYKAIEERGIQMPISEVHCKFLAPAQYDDLIVIETTLDPSVKGSMMLNYSIFDENGQRLLAQGYTRLAYMDRRGQVIRPPDFLLEFIENCKRHTT
jgi:acyl-CoA thioester hydrolase